MIVRLVAEEDMAAGNGAAHFDVDVPFDVDTPTPDELREELEKQFENQNENAEQLAEVKAELKDTRQKVDRKLAEVEDTKGILRQKERKVQAREKACRFNDEKQKMLEEMLDENKRLQAENQKLESENQQLQEFKTSVEDQDGSGGQGPSVDLSDYQGPSATSLKAPE